MHQQPNRQRSLSLGADHLTRPAVGAGDEPAPPWPDRGRGPAPGRPGRPGGATAAARPDHRTRSDLEQPGSGCLAVRGAPGLERLPEGGDRRWPVATSLGPTGSDRCCPASPPAASSPGPTSHRPSGPPGRSALAREPGAGGSRRLTAPAPTPAGSGAQGSEHPSESRAIPLPIPPRATGGVVEAPSAHSRRPELPSPGVAPKNRARLPGSRWCGSFRRLLLERPAGEEKRPANPGRAAIHGLGVKVQGRALGIDPDPSAPRPSAALDAPQAVAR
jgi:hypothetical protein